MQNKNEKSLFGIDINEHSQNVNFTTLATRIDFIYLRSSGSGTGRFRVDKKFLQFAREARNFGIPVGAYHYGIPSYDVNTADMQCDDFINILQQGFGSKDYGDLFPVLDVEEPKEKIISTTALINWIDRFRKRFERKTRRRLMLYVSSAFVEIYDNFLVPGRGFPLRNMPLWIAMYTKIPGNPPYPNDGGGWTRWRIWQYSEDANVMGVGNPVDANWGPNNIDLLIQPSVVTGLKANKEGGNIVVTWNRVPDVDLLGYNLFVNNSWVGTVDESDAQFIIKRDKINVPSGTSISISIEAFDYDGETSKRRAKVVL
ncbi:glycoside hydrolase family 25 protein [Clostridium sp. SHJSY1]|uniref:glycoside hydrolase family 25 protein n=1 Tax=Clostridium sp. SHJSY1 TaxID=2942483 RepID=UPI002875177D|nr:glycoside hydrolase family 25 protein [Clostridium sp. SHJSY1]MDS0526862.1 glycoside hydrolase family 25 protein [Clostridium sp. SHJSY1]